MDKPVLETFVRHVKEQAGFAVIAHERAIAALNAMGAIPGEGWLEGGARLHAAAMSEFWLEVQVFIGCAANVSKLLWGQGAADERADVRAAVNVDDTSLLFDRDLRNHFEHIDERIDRWSRMPVASGLRLDTSIGPLSDLIAMFGRDQPVAIESFFRFYDPSTGELSFWADRVKIHELAAELERVRDTASP